MRGHGAAARPYRRPPGDSETESESRTVTSQSWAEAGPAARLAEGSADALRPGPARASDHRIRSLPFKFPLSLSFQSLRRGSGHGDASLVACQAAVRDS